MSAVKRSSRVASEAKTIVTILNTLLLGKAMSGPLLGKALGEVSPVNKNEASAQREILLGLGAIGILAWMVTDFTIIILSKAVKRRSRTANRLCTQ